jgi:hypothetical protein
MDEIDRNELLRGPSVGIAPVLVRYRLSVSTDVVMASLFGVRTALGLHAFLCAIDVTLPVPRKRCCSFRNALAPA